MMIAQEGVSRVNANKAKFVSFLQQATEILAKSSKDSIKQISLSNGSPTIPNSSIRMVPAKRLRVIGVAFVCSDGQAIVNPAADVSSEDKENHR
jgi:hypothetical protein